MRERYGPRTSTQREPEQQRPNSRLEAFSQTAMGGHASHHHIVTHCHWVRQGICQASAGLPVGLLMLAPDAPFPSLSSAIQGVFPVAERRDRLQGNCSWRSPCLSGITVPQLSLTQGSCRHCKQMCSHALRNIMLSDERPFHSAVCWLLWQSTHGNSTLDSFITARWDAMQHCQISRASC